MTRLTALAAALALLASPALAAPADDGFAAFWPAFSAAAAKDDQAALARMTHLGLQDGDTPTSFAEIHKQYLTASERRCLAKAHPQRDVDPTGGVSYDAFCGQLIYVFTRTAAGWQWTDLSPDD